MYWNYAIFAITSENHSETNKYIDLVLARSFANSEK